MTAPDVRVVATYLPVSRELLADVEPVGRIGRYMAAAMEDLAFYLLVGRSRWTNTAAIVMWRRWPGWLGR